MSGIIERAARAIYDYSGQRGVSWEEVSESTRLGYKAIARSVIEEMRNPTDEMLAAANRNNHPRDIETWQTMIDVALSEKIVLPE